MSSVFVIRSAPWYSYDVRDGVPLPDALAAVWSRVEAAMLPEVRRSAEQSLASRGIAPDDTDEYRRELLATYLDSAQHPLRLNLDALPWDGDRR